MKRKSSSNGLFAFANVLVTVAGIAATMVGNRERSQYDALRAENIRLRNQTEHLRMQQASNNVVKGDLDLEFKMLKIAELKKKLGLDQPAFVAEGYDDPGDVRRGVPYKQ
jgi:hypothetical protein